MPYWSRGGRRDSHFKPRYQILRRWPKVHGKCESLHAGAMHYDRADQYSITDAPGPPEAEQQAAGMQLLCSSSLEPRWYICNPNLILSPVQCPVWRSKRYKEEILQGLLIAFSSKLFAGKFGDNWYRHQENFIKYCEELAITESEFPDDLKETFKGDALKFVADMIKMDQNKLETKCQLSYRIGTPTLTDRNQYRTDCKICVFPILKQTEKNPRLSPSA